jgi:hypothetical protein
MGVMTFAEMKREVLRAAVEAAALRRRSRREYRAGLMDDSAVTGLHKTNARLLFIDCGFQVLDVLNRDFAAHRTP